MNKILILDDSRDMLETFRLIFEMNGDDIKTAHNRDAFQQILGGWLPHIIVMDVFLHGEDGREICQQLKLHPHTRDIPVILMSANPNKLKDFQDFNASGVLEKPFNISDLMLTVKSHVTAS